ncbi:TetR/AcrR family transcriptional regulator [Rhodococcus jostii]|uniref:TetR/AcrR family transcriptional regulator n=1 Tax=Rhodococcus jostii TaxID=132919 RepID=UPI00365CD85A
MVSPDIASTESDTTHGESTHARIIRVATELFAERGFHATGVMEIGERAQVKRGALYYHIKSKDDLFFDILHRHVREMIEEAEMIVAAHPDPEERLRNLAKASLRKITERRPEMILWQREMHVFTGQYALEMVALRDKYESYWSSALAQGFDEGVFKSADPVVVKGLIGMVGYTYLWLREGDLTPDQVADRLLDLALDGCGTPVRRDIRSRAANSDTTPH